MSTRGSNVGAVCAAANGATHPPRRGVRSRRVLGPAHSPTHAGQEAYFVFVTSAEGQPLLSLSRQHMTHALERHSLGHDKAHSAHD